MTMIMVPWMPLYVPRSGLLCICHLRPIWRNACQLFWVGRPGRSYWHFQLLDILWWKHEVCTPDATTGRMIWQHGCLVAYLAPDSWGTGSYPDFWFALAIVLLAHKCHCLLLAVSRHILYLLRRPPARLSNNTLLQTSKAAHLASHLIISMCDPPPITLLSLSIFISDTLTYVL